jgi:hypothetical protein
MESFMHVDQLNKLLETYSKRNLAKAIGINHGILTQYLKKDYNGKVENVDAKIKAFLEREAQRGDQWTDAIVSTETMRKILKVIHLIHLMKKMGIVYGAAGLGKTESAKAYIARTPGSYHLTALPDSKSVAGAINLIHFALFKEEQRYSPRTARRMIVDRLKGSDSMIIIDDAHKLGNDALEEVRAIHDQSGCAFTLIGTEEILNRLIDPRAGRILAQMSSRLPVRRMFPLQPSNADLKLVCEAYGVTDKEVIKRLAEKGKRGGLRLAVHQIKIARHIAKGATVKMEDLLAAEAVSGDYVETANQNQDEE